jgi:hypothetical protein
MENPMHIGEPQPPPDEPDTDGPAWLLSKAWARAELVIWGAHGGAGATTLATWLQPAWDMGPARPAQHPRYPATVAAARPLIIACRSTARSAHAATTAVAAVTKAGSRVAVLAIVSDGWPEPPSATARFRLLEPQTDLIVRVPFVPGLRLVDDPASAALPRRAVRALDQIRVATGGARHIR